MARRSDKQLELPLRIHGGARRGAGRKRQSKRPQVPHRMRPQLAARSPMHVTVRMSKGLPSLRRVACRKVLNGAFAAGKERFGFRLIHYSIQSNHMHLLVEAKDREAISRGMKGLLVRIARGLNRLWRRTGRVFADRFHQRILRTPKEVRNALVYVLNNARKYGIRLVGLLHAFASGRWFSGWRGRRPGAARESAERPVSQARTWLLSEGWRRHGLIGAREIPPGAGG